MPFFISLLFLSIFSLNLGWAQELPLKDFWLSQGFCPNDWKIESDYLTIQNKNIYGTHFKVKACQDLNFTQFKENLLNQGFKIIKSSEEEIIGCIDNEEGKLYLVYDSSDEFALKILKQVIIKPNQEKEIVLPSDEKVFFYLDYPQGKYLSMTVIPSDNETNINISIEGELKKRKLTQKIYYNRKIDPKEGPNYILDLPLLPGLQLFSISAYKETRIKIKVKEEGNIIPLKLQDKTGGILLKNVPYGSAKVKPEAGVEYFLQSLVEESVIGNRTPQGDIIFWLPPGYWQLEVDPFQDEDSSISLLKARLIPVFPGYLTEVVWPASINRMFKTQEQARLEIFKSSATQTEAYLDFSLLNIGPKNVVPKKENLEIFEAGLPAKVLRVERIKSPPEIVILLDSSGSMRNSMKKALEATAKFLKGIPPKSRVTLIDFDTQPRLVSKGNPQKVLASLSQIKANGATALYDALKMGLSLLQQANRPALILFTDGKDANWNDTGPGSKTTAKEIFSIVKSSNVPIFTIGFGKSPDTNTLSRLAALTGGAYYPASNSRALNQVFTKIQQNLGNQWRVYYTRPKAIPAGDKPVLLLVVDNSGSMEGNIERVRHVLRNFVAALPEDFLIQFMIFSGEVEVKQVLTDDRLAIYRALSEMKALESTAILKSLEASYQLLHSVPSSNRYLVYLTDEALAVDEDEQEKFKLILQQLKDDGVKSLFIGMVDREHEEAFKKAALLAGGQHVILPDFGHLEETLDKLLAQIGKAPKSKYHLIRLVYKHLDPYGRVSIYTAATKSKDPLPLSQEKVKDPEAIAWKKGEKIRPYDGELARFITGDDIIGRQVQVLKRIPLNVSASNKAVKITLKEAVLLSKLRGVEPPNGKFLALTLKMENILPPQEVVVYPDGSAHPSAWLGSAGDQNARVEKRIPDYLIPDAKIHFFLSWNNKTRFPLSEATYLAEKPLILPGEDEIFLRPGQPIEGTFIFVVPNEFMEQCALHLYDTAYGHLDLPISGILKIKKEEIASLPTKVTRKLSDTFSLKIDGYKDTKKIYEVSPEEGNIFRIVEITLTSKVQAHLAIEPAERFFLYVDTPEGSFRFSLHPVTSRYPLGFYSARLVAPGSHNKARLVFELPEALANMPAKLFIDLQGGGVEFPIVAKTLPSPKAPLAQGKAKGAILSIQGVYQHEKQIVLDVVITDEKDEVATEAYDYLLFKLTPEALKRLYPKQEKIPTNVMKPKGLGSFGRNLGVNVLIDEYLPDWTDYLVGCSCPLLVFNGKSRRCFAFFELPDNISPSDLILTSKVFEGLNYKIPAKLSSFPYEAWLTFQRPYEIDDSFFYELNKAIWKLTQIRRAKGFTKPGSANKMLATLDGSIPKGLPVEPPSLLKKGAISWQEIKTIEELKHAVSSFQLKASNLRAWQAVYAPEAVFTQGWLTENELALMAEKVLGRQSLETQRMLVELSPEGEGALRNVFSSSEIELSELPAIKYEDQEGKEHILVIPFFKEANEIKNLISTIEEASGRDSLSFSLEVNLKVEPLSSGAQEALGTIADALAVSDEEELKNIQLLSYTTSLPEASLGSFTLGFFQTIDKQKGRIIKAVLDSPTGRTVSEDALELAKYKLVQLELKFYLSGETFKTIRDFKEKEWPTEMFFVIGVNVPDLTESSLNVADNYWKSSYKEAHPDVLSSVKWLGQGIIARFVGAQTAYEQELAKKLGLEIVRLEKTRILVVDLRFDRQKNRQITSLDIVNPYPELRGDEEQQKKFNLLAGFYYSHLESQAVPNGLNAFKLLSLMPPENKMLLFLPEDTGELSEILKNSGYPRFVWEHFKNNSNFVLFPEKPLALSENAFRTAWLEIDPDTYKVWSFLDSGERGVVESRVLGESLASALDYAAGFWIGVQNSVWATAAFSLILDDWNQIKTCAHGFARRLGSYLEATTQPVDTLKPDAGKAQSALSGDVAGAIGLSNMDYGCMGAGELQKLVKEHAESKAWSAEDVKSVVEGSKQLKDLAGNAWEKAREKYLGFANGYKDGVDWYFK
ncbi:vWA domain-containing protein [Thermodesulfatator autotrophicus]|uniref:VWFA domain-containing protein n=1 Tax=Thermodesulfatator autotrophicus TaxID=1795632 RepID=A0A177E760_9BACT|nr:VWA domain-containing protein [Thermodesulfatator autotrophicus]OAG26849.1 hypothetical protein TH606_10090 [Thermodesulfatator autotrophicus]